jgi:hypothetical protein
MTDRGTTWPLARPPAPVAARPGRGPAVVIAALLAGEAALTALLIQAGREVAVSAAVLLTGAAVIGALLFALPRRDQGPVAVLFAAGLLLRVVSLVIIHAVFSSPANPHAFLFPDSVSYDLVGANIADHWRAGRSARIEYQTAGFTIGYHYAVALVYLVAGRAPLVMQSLNVLLSASLVPLTFVLGRRLAGREAGLTAALCVAVWPPTIYWSVQLLKDIAITFLLLVSALNWVAFARRPRLLLLLLAVVPAAPLVFLRTYMFLFWTFGVAAGLFVLARARGRSFIAVLLALAVAGAGIYGALEYSALRFRSIEIWVAKLSAVGTVQGSLFTGVIYRSLGDVLAFYPLGFARFLLTPLPWKADLLFWPEAVGSVVRYALLPFAAAGIVQVYRKERVAVFPLLVTGFLAVSLYAAAFRGGGPRHMTQLYPYFFVFAAAGAKRFRDWPLVVAAGGIGFLGAAILIRLA